MIDIHSHILPNIDDGSRSVKESLNIMKMAAVNGVTDIVVTPHFILGSIYNSNKNANEELLSKLKEEIAKENIAIHLYLGNEIFVDNTLLELLENGTVSTLNNSKYVLFELPMNCEYKGIKNLIFKLKSNGYIPIIAHPERYRILKQDPSKILELYDCGALFQGNMGSLFGHYGKDAKNTLKIFLKHHVISFLASDIHHEANTFYNDISELEKKLKKFLDEEYIQDLLVNNARKVLNNEKIILPDTILPIKVNIFKQYK